MKRRTLFLALASGAMAIALGFELGSEALTGKVTASEAELRAMIEANVDPDADIDRDEMLAEMKERQRKADPPGIAIPMHALVDGWLLLTFLLWLLADLVSAAFVAKIQGILNLILSIVLLIVGIMAIFAAIGLFFLMLSLFLAVPFGTLAYLAAFGFFDRAGAGLCLGFVMGFKALAIVFGFLATRTILSNKSLVMLILFSLLATLLTSCLHGLVPSVLVSIADALAAIIIAVLGLLWALFNLIGALLSLISALRSAV